MKQITFRGTPVMIAGALPEVGSVAPEFLGVKSDLEEIKLSGYKDRYVFFNIFSCINAGVCAWHKG